MGLLWCHVGLKGTPHMQMFLYCMVQKFSHSSSRKVWGKIVLFLRVSMRANGVNHILECNKLYFLHRRGQRIFHGHTNRGEKAVILQTGRFSLIFLRHFKPDLSILFMIVGVVGIVSNKIWKCSFQQPALRYWGRQRERQNDKAVSVPGGNQATWKVTIKTAFDCSSVLF